MNEKKYISFDIDGVLNDYPLCWLIYLNNYYLTNYTDIKKARLELGEEKYKKAKYLYRTSGYKLNIPFNFDGLELALFLKNQGYHILVSTSRPIYNRYYGDLKNLTSQWLIKNKFPYDEIVFKMDELVERKLYERIHLHIDDELSYAEKMTKLGVKSIIISRNKVLRKNTNIFYESSLLDVIDNWNRYK
ncbi:hypothetical protein [Salinivibrio sp. AR640]|uniref:hypothetical protein n=1 Tax=Salinivibrio sp. AR640 TaxID=1909437 RepID=UPI0009851C6A|nr:hypothetical protein [Salinivibrio sp. AR640]OOE93157.1 hypothetical protein BZG75_07730 [Salinivibrio sp. AR640]